MPKRIDNLLVWGADGIEENTLDQAAKASRLPFVHSHLALMPDAHVGIGATIGSVIATQGAVVPSAVGVDIGCVDGETEYLSPSGWRHIRDYEDDNGPVMQYDSETGMASFVQPQRYVKREQDEFLIFNTKYGIDQAVTPDHKMLCWKPTGRARSYEPMVMSAEDYAADHERLVLGNKAAFQTTFEPQLETSLPLSDDELRVMVMVMADGHIDRKRCVVRLRKTRKIDRVWRLLEEAGIQFTEGVSPSDGVTWFRFTPPMLAKSYDWCWPASADQLRIVVDEVFHWDGNQDERCFYTRDRESADFMHYAFSATGSRGVLRSDENDDGKFDYRVFAQPNTLVAMGGCPKTAIRRAPAGHPHLLDGLAYCFTVPSGFWIMRRGSNIAVTGNCGMMAARTQFTANDLPDSLGRLHGMVRSAVPAGVGQGHEVELDGSGAQLAPVLMGKLPEMVIENTKAWKKTVEQLGSLGSGNHFVELCLDEDERVWVMLHSGSRGIGNQLATQHIAEAKGLMKKYFIELEDPDLAYFVEGTENFDAYIHDMLWAQDYAAANRERMMAAVLEQLFVFMERSPEIDEQVNCHHNYCEQEHHNGRNLWVTRKGAIRARKDDLGIIPGSMATGSYIVRGLGNPVSFMSASHGAGRRMSRGQARKTVTTDELNAAMAGKTWNDRDVKTLLDEAPAAYKPIEEVMAAQSDLVEITHSLTQILNYKGTN